MGKILAAALCLLFSCSGKTARENEAANKASRSDFDVSGGSHCWFCFSNGEILPVDLPENAPPQAFVPWTEAARVSAAAQDENSAYFLINKMGLVRLADETSKKCQIFGDALYFGGATADSLTIIDKIPVFKLHRNDFFYEGERGEKFPFLVQFREDSKTFYPLLANADLGLNENCEAVALSFDGKNWTGAFKNSASQRILFDYLQFSTQKSLVNLADIKRGGQIQKKAISPQFYQSCVQPKPFEQAEEDLKNLLADVAKSAPVFVKAAKPDGISPSLWTNGIFDENPFCACVFVGKDFSVAVFEDGTAYFCGSLTARGEKTAKTFALPALPENFKYGDIALCSKILYAAWEECDFYKTGRSGFLAVDLENVLRQ